MALLLFVVAWLLTAIGGFVATPTMTHERSVALGQIVGCVMWPMLLLSLAIAGVAPTRPRLAIVLAACVMVFPVGTTAFVWSLAHGSYHEPTAAERAAPTLADGANGPVLRQPALGLEFPAPIGMDLVEDDETLNDALASNAAGEHMVSWRWTSPDESRQVMVVVDIESPRSRERQREYIGQVGETLSADLRAQGFTVLASGGEDADWLIAADHRASGLIMRMRLFGYQHDDRFIVVTITVQPEDPALDVILTRAHGAG